jgi:Natural resistance-associated macrophage protein
MTECSNFHAARQSSAEPATARRDPLEPAGGSPGLSDYCRQMLAGRRPASLDWYSALRRIPVAVLMIGFTAIILTLEILVSYRRYARVLKWLTLSLLAYPITAFLVPEPWGTIFRATFVPHIEFSAAFFYVITAVIGTTITPYMFFWQCSQEVQENQGRKTRRSLTDLRTDNAVGMFASQAVCWFSSSGIIPSHRWNRQRSSRPRSCSPAVPGGRWGRVHSGSRRVRVTPTTHDGGRFCVIALCYACGCGRTAAASTCELGRCSGPSDVFSVM